MNRFTWAVVLVAGFAIGLGYGVARGFNEVAPALLLLLLLLLLAAVLVARENEDHQLAVEPGFEAVPETEPEPTMEPVTDSPPIGFHPTR